MGKLYASLLLPCVVIGLRVYTSFCYLCGIHQYFVLLYLILSQNQYLGSLGLITLRLRRK